MSINTNHRQLISVMIPTYNCAKYLKKTIESVLEQDMGSIIMQIEVIDDCSTDEPEKIVSEFGKNRVEFFRQERNVGHVRNFETAINRARGQIIHLLHGDDYVLPGFYAGMLKMYEQHPEIGACYCRHFFVDEDDNINQISELRDKQNIVLHNFDQILIHGQKIQTPSITVKKEVYDKLGTFNPNLSWTEDWEMWVRISSNYPVGYIKEPLACYRMHSGSSTASKSIIGENVNDMLRLKNIFTSYTNNSVEEAELEKSFRKIIFNIASRNYHVSKSIQHPDAFKHLITMSKYVDSTKLRMLLYMNYLLKKACK